MSRTQRFSIISLCLVACAALAACELDTGEGDGDPIGDVDDEPGEAGDDNVAYSYPDCRADAWLFSRTDGLISSGTYSWPPSYLCNYDSFVELLGASECEALCGCDRGPDFYCHAYDIRAFFLVSERDYECEGICNH